MLKRERGIDNSFRPPQRLYFRITFEDVVGVELIEARIKLKDQSVNWGKYAWPWDVIFDYHDCGIAQIRVRDVPERLLPDKINEFNNEKFHTYFVVHNFEELNYAHSEIKVKRGDIILSEKQSIAL